MGNIVKTAKCRFCGQMTQIEADEKLTAAQAEEQATMTCNCTEAVEYQKEKQRKEKAIGIVYVVGAVVVFLAMTAFYIWVDRASKKEQELYYDEYYYPDDKFAERMSVVVWFILSLGCAILWVGIPLLICGLIVYTELEEHSCCGRKEDGQNNRRPLSLRRIRACTV